MESELLVNDNDKKKLTALNNDLVKKLEDQEQVSKSPSSFISIIIITVIINTINTIFFIVIIYYHYKLIRSKAEIEARLTLNLNDLDRNFKEELSNKDKELSKCVKINGDLDSDINDKANIIKEMKSIIESKQNEIELLVSNCQVLSKDLNTAITSKRILEEEAARIRADMTERMHKLRTNMHSLLHREESESKIIESQITQLTAELEATKHRYHTYHHYYYNHYH